MVSLIQRAYRSYQRGGMRALGHGLQWRTERLMRRAHWARWGGLSVLLAKTVRPLSPPVLILSLPRSGSSWTGDTLGQAANAMYLREPFTQTEGVNDPIFFYDQTEWAFDKEPAQLLAGYGHLVKYAFSGLPRFNRQIVPYPEQWNLMGRTQRRLVIKEVRSLAHIWLVPDYRPLVIFLVRHPAAVALSYQSMRWLKITSEADWYQHGERQARVQRLILDQLENYSDKCYVQYETLCADPIGQFQSLFKFARLKWTSKVEQLIRDRNRDDGSDQDRQPYGLVRDSQRMIDSWRGKIDEAALKALRKGYATYPVPWYQSDDDWRI